MNRFPKVGVVIAVYNSEKFVEEAIESILNQTYQDFEIIVVDDGSTDESADIIKSFNDKRIIYMYQENQGHADAKNKGVLRSKGKYKAFLDSDDVWLPEKLEKQVAILDSNPEIALVYSDCYYADVRGKVMARAFKRAKPFRVAVFSQLFLSNFIPFSTVVVRKEIFEKVGLFNPKYFIAPDYDLFLRIAKHFKIEYVDLPLAKYRIHKANISKNFILNSQETIEILDKFLGENPGIRRRLGTKVNSRFYEAHCSLARAYQFEKKFAESREEFITSAKYYPFGITSYIGYLCSLLKIVIPNREKVLKRLISSQID